MTLRSQFIPLAQQPDELAKQVHAVVTDIFCRGITKSLKVKPDSPGWPAGRKYAVPGNKLVSSAVIVIVAYPLGLIGTIISKIVPLLIFLVVWWFLRDAIADFGLHANKIVLTLGIVMIFYKQIYQDVISFLVCFAIIFTGGGFLRWISNAYLNGFGFAKASYESKVMQGLMEGYAVHLPHEHQVEYEELMNLYHDSKKPENKERLEQLVAAYWSDSRGQEIDNNYDGQKKRDFEEHWHNRMKTFVEVRISAMQSESLNELKRELETASENSEFGLNEEIDPETALIILYKDWNQSALQLREDIESELQIYLYDELEVIDALGELETATELVETILEAKQIEFLDGAKSTFFARLDEIATD